MLPILLINPNTSQATTDMMVAMAQDTAGTSARIRGETATRGPSMITTPKALAASEAGVVEIAVREAGTCAGIIVAAFGDPGAAALKRRLAVPVVGHLRGRHARSRHTWRLLCRGDDHAGARGAHRRKRRAARSRGPICRHVADRR